MLFGVSEADPVTIAAVTLLIIAVGHWQRPFQHGEHLGSIRWWHYATNEPGSQLGITEQTYYRLVEDETPGPWLSLPRHRREMQNGGRIMAVNPRRKSRLTFISRKLPDEPLIANGEALTRAGKYF